MSSRVTGSWKPGLILVALLLGDGVKAEPPPTNGGQGAKLHGTGRFEHVNIPLASARLPDGSLWESFRLQQGNLKGLGGGREYTGLALANNAVFSAPFDGQTVQFKITAVRAHTSLLTAPNPSQSLIPREVPWEYQVTWTLGRESGPLCSTGGGFALAVPHAWSPAAEFLVNHKYFTFSCLPDKRPDGLFFGGGVITKCIDWGYPPWDRETVRTTYKGQPATPYSGEAALKFHQACVRMATADYCGEGRANTLDGTPIAFYDVDWFKTSTVHEVFPGPLTLASPSGYYNGNYYLEAIWGLGPCNELKVLCLGKRRWETLSLDETCLLRRELGTEPQLMGQVPLRLCEDWSEEEIKERGLLISYSTFLDRALVRFKHDSDPTAFLTTSSVEWLPRTRGTYYYGSDTYKPAQQFRTSPYRSQATIEGPIFGPRTPRSFVAGLHLKQLYRCKHTSANLYLTTDRLNCEGFTLYRLDGFVDLAVEGYIYPEGRGINNNPLYLWKNGDRYATSALRPGNSYTKVRLLGFLPSVSQLAERYLNPSGP